MARKKGRRSKPYKLNLKKDTLNSILAVAIIGVGGLIAISFSQQGVFLKKIYDLGHDLIGWPLLFMPFIFIVGGLLLTQAKIAIASPHVLLGSVITMISLAGLTGSGGIGSGIKESVVALISFPGAILFYLVGVAIGLFILFETSIEDLIVILQTISQKISEVGGKIQPISFGKKDSVFINKSSGVKISGGSDEPLLTNPHVNTHHSEPAKTLQKETSVPAAHIQKPLPEGATSGIWQYPPLTLLSDQKLGKADRGDIKKNIEIIEKTLESFGLQAHVTEVNKGPAVTQYALDIAMGTKLSKINALQSDLALALAAPQGQIRIEAPIPGRNLVGIEIPNRSLEFVSLRDMLDSEAMQTNRSKTLVALGLDVSGQPCVVDLAKMPHVLIAGTTGSGKSVLINDFISSILFRCTPEEVKLILVDPKRVELTPYNDIPHLLTPVITDVEKVVNALAWAVSEMERRYKVLQETGVRNISSYNEQAGFTAMPYIIIIVDEMADIMMSKSAGDVEHNIVRLAQMARAVGVHLVLATQRPSVNVLTGLIKANIPARIAFQVTSMIDSRVIIDSPGAEKLLGKGDMLFIPPDLAKPKRIQGAFVSDREINDLIKFIRSTGVEAKLDDTITKSKVNKGTGEMGSSGGGQVDEKFDEAAQLVISSGKASASLLQRRMGLGYARAARILDQLEDAGIISPAEGNKPREVIAQGYNDILPPQDNTEE